ncbi:MAG: hypothetical protein LBQ66_15755 [Planctomycetaceae bacterium]|jgi:hypothetical protein|nr:hypothetical protein [Planctomycetaceae bacterium]
MSNKINMVAQLPNIFSDQHTQVDRITTEKIRIKARDHLVLSLIMLGFSLSNLSPIANSALILWLFSTLNNSLCFTNIFIGIAAIHLVSGGLTQVPQLVKK